MTERPAGSAARLLVVSEVFPPVVGGSGELMLQVYRRIVGPAVTVLTDGVPGADPIAGLDVRREALHARHWGLIPPPSAAHHLRRAFRQRRIVGDTPTVTHCCGTLPEGLDAWLASGLGAGPYLCWAHGEELAIITSSREYTWLATRILRKASAVLANSHNTATWLSRLRVPSSKIRIVYPGVDTTRFRPDRPESASLRRRLAPAGETLLLTVGRLQRRKGHDLVIRALAALGEPHALRYVIVGDGKERAPLEDLARSLGVATQVLFVGPVPTAELPDYYAAADVFLHPNRVDDDGDFEGFGIVFLEAAASGVAVIGGASGGVPEAVADDVTGILVSGTDAAELASAIRRLHQSPETRRAMGEAGRARAVRKFSWDRAAADVTAIHAEVAHAHRRGATP